MCNFTKCACGINHYHGFGADMNTVTIESKAEVSLTPQLMAEAFWAMDSQQQADFFAALADAVKRTQGAYGYGEMQWCYMRDDIRKNKEASNMYMALSAFAFDYWSQKDSLE